MTEKRKFEFFLLRYAPHAIRERYVDFGLIVREIGGAEYAGLRFADSWRDLRGLDPVADIDYLDALRREIEGQFAVLKDRETLIRWVLDSHSNAVRLSDERFYESADIEGDIEALAFTYLKGLPLPQSQPGKETGRQAILKEMRSQLETYGVWDFLIHGVPAAKYTKVGDPFKFDFGYLSQSGRKEFSLLHAVSLEANVNTAVTLAARYPMIANAMRISDEHYEPMLTAVIDDGLPISEKGIGFAIGMMKDNGIKVRPAAEMRDIALDAKRTLGL